MLGSHADLLCVPEMQFKFDILRFAGREAQADLIGKLATRSSFRIWELDIDTIAVPGEQLRGRALIEKIVRAYGAKVDKPAPTMWVDHTPRNIRYAWTFFRAFPEATMVHIVRDGRAVGASVLPLDWGPNEIDSAARFWAERLAYGLAAESFWRKKVVRVRYEDLVQYPQTTLRGLCETLEIDYDPAMCSAAGFPVPKYTAKQHALIGREPDPTRVNAWEKQLTARQIEIFESIASDLLETLGYTPQFGLSARPMSRRERMLAGVREFYKREFSNQSRKRKRKRETIP
jgi:hypothetical protein